MYNLISGVNPATFFILPMLGEKHPDQYPRFRDCFVENEDTQNPEIHIYTRVGGGNRNCGYGEDELYKHPNFITTFDDDFDCTYATYVFSVPDEWKDDFKKIVGGEMKTLSGAYKKRLYVVFPKFKEKFDELLGV